MLYGQSLFITAMFLTDERLKSSTDGSELAAAVASAGTDSQTGDKDDFD